MGTIARKLEGDHGHSGEVYSVFMHNQPGRVPILLSGSYDNTALAWNLDFGDSVRIVRDPKGHTDYLTGVQIVKPEGESPLLVTVSEDYSGCVWRLTPSGWYPSIYYFFIIILSLYK